MWIVMTSAAKMPTSVKSPYRNVALVQLTPEYAAANQRPAMISKRARGIRRLEHWGHYYVGATERAAFQRAFAEATAEVAHRNAANDEARKRLTADLNRNPIERTVS